MKKTFILASLALSVSLNAQATVIDFEDLTPGTQQQLANGYAGFDWNTNTGDGWALSSTAHGGAYGGYSVLANATGSDVVGYNAFARNPLDITASGGGTFDFNSGWFASAWDRQLDVTVQGWLGGSLQHSQTMSLSNLVASFVTFKFTNIDTLRFLDRGNHMAFDNLTFNKVSEVPVPAAAFLFAPALLGFMGLRRKAKTVA